MLDYEVGDGLIGDGLGTIHKEMKAFVGVGKLQQQ
jgi:hypothetical protein